MEAATRAHDSEAGHADFAPLDELQDRLLASLRGNFGRVSYERVVSGPGLMRIFSFLQEAGIGTPSREMIDASGNAPTQPRSSVNSAWRSAIRSP
jgi:glucokinase